MRFDLLASELMSLLTERWPYGGHGQIMAELYVEDALKAVAEAERERVVSLIQTQISKLRGRSNAYSSNAANQLQEVIDNIRREEDASTPKIVPEEELDRW